MINICSDKNQTRCDSLYSTSFFCQKQGYVFEPIISDQIYETRFCGSLTFCCLPYHLCVPRKLYSIKVADIRLRNYDCACPVIALKLNCEILGSSGKSACVPGNIDITAPDFLAKKHPFHTLRLGAVVSVLRSSFTDICTAKAELKIFIRTLITDGASCRIHAEKKTDCSLPLYPPAVKFSNTAEKFNKSLDSCVCLE